MGNGIGGMMAPGGPGGGGGEPSQKMKAMAQIDMEFQKAMRMMGMGGQIGQMQSPANQQFQPPTGAPEAMGNVATPPSMSPMPSGIPSQPGGTAPQPELGNFDMPYPMASMPNVPAAQPPAAAPPLPPHMTPSSTPDTPRHMPPDPRVQGQAMQNLFRTGTDGQPLPQEQDTANYQHIPGGTRADLEGQPYEGINAPGAPPLPTGPSGQPQVPFAGPAAPPALGPSPEMPYPIASMPNVPLAQPSTAAPPAPVGGGGGLPSMEPINPATEFPAPEIPTPEPEPESDQKRTMPRADDVESMDVAAAESVAKVAPPESPEGEVSGTDGIRGSNAHIQAANIFVENAKRTGTKIKFNQVKSHNDDLQSIFSSGNLNVGGHGHSGNHKEMIAGFESRLRGREDRKSDMISSLEYERFYAGLMITHLRRAKQSGADKATLQGIVDDYHNVFSFTSHGANVISDNSSEVRDNPAYEGAGYVDGTTAQQEAKALDESVYKTLTTKESFQLFPALYGAAKSVVTEGPGLAADAGNVVMNQLGFPKTDEQLKDDGDLRWWHHSANAMPGDKDSIIKLHSKTPGPGEKSPWREYIDFNTTGENRTSLRRLMMGYIGAFGEGDDRVHRLYKEMNSMRGELQGRFGQGADIGQELELVAAMARGDLAEGVDLPEDMTQVELEGGDRMVDGRILTPSFGDEGSIEALLRGTQADPLAIKLEPGMPGYDPDAEGDQYGRPQSAAFMAGTQTDDMGNILKPGDVGYDNEKGLKSMVQRGDMQTPVLPESIGRASPERQAQITAAAKKQSEAKVVEQQTEFDRQTKMIKDTENAAMASYDAGTRKHGARKPGQVSASLADMAHDMATGMLKTEVDASMFKLNSDQALLEFGQTLSEAFTQIGDSLVHYSSGVRMGGPSFVPKSIIQALGKTGAAKQAELMRFSTFAMSGHLFPSGTSVESMNAQIPLLKHSQDLKQKALQFNMTLENNSWQAMLNYQEKLLGHKLNAANKEELRRQWSLERSDQREQWAYRYSLDRAKANLEQAGSLKLDRLELDTIEALYTTIDMGNDVIREKPKFGTGWFNNWYESLGNYLGYGNPEWHKFKQKVTMQLNIYVNRLTGKQLSRHEVARLKGAVPQMTDDDAIFTAKAQTFVAIQEVILRRKLRTYALNGHDVTPFMGDMPMYWQNRDGTGQRSGTATQYNNMIQRSPHLLGQLDMLTGVGGSVIREGDDYLGEIMGNYIIRGPDGKPMYNEAVHGKVDPTQLALGTTQRGSYMQQGVRRVGQRQAAQYIPGMGRALGRMVGGRYGGG